MTPTTLRAARQEAVDTMAGLITRADREARDLTAAELGQVQRLRADIDAIDAQLADTGGPRLTVATERRIMHTGAHVAADTAGALEGGGRPPSAPK